MPMNSRDAALRRYYRQVKGWLPCSRKQKNYIMSEIRASVDAYLSENPNADFRRIEAHFGKPQTIASAYVDDLDTGSLLRSLRIRKRVMTTVSCTALALLLIWASGVAAVIAIHANESPAYIEVEVDQG